MRLNVKEDEREKARPAPQPVQARNAQPPNQPEQPKRPGAYDPSTDQNYQNAMNALNQAQQNKPTFTDPYADQIKNAFDQLTNREKFQFNLNGDAMWNAYKDQYTMMGQAAMRDTMGQAAGLTGGYGNTYGQQVGQQAYNAYLTRLNEVIPEVRNAQFQQYQAEGDQMRDNYQMLLQQQDKAHADWREALGDHERELDRLQGNVDDAYQHGMNAWQQGQILDDKEYDRQQDAADREWREEQDAYDKQQHSYKELVDLILGGYVPDEEELKAAGMSNKRYEYYKNLYQQSLIPASSGGGGGGRGGNGNDGNKTAGNRAPSFNWDMHALQDAGASQQEMYEYLKNAEKAGVLSKEDAKRAEDHYFPHGFPHGNPSKKPVRKPTINDQVSFYDKHKLPSSPSSSLKKKEEEKKRRR